MHPQYFEGRLQLRNPSQEVIDYVATEIEKADNVWIAKSVNQKKGIDLFISSNKFLSIIGKKLKEKFTGELVKSKKLFSRNRMSGKEVYRGCVLFRYYDFKKGDIISHRGDKIKIISVRNDIFGQDIQTMKKMHIKFSDLRVS